MTASPEVISKLRQMWKVLCDNVSDTEERVWSSTEYAKAADVPGSYAGRMMRFFRGVGIFTYYSTYESADSPNGRGQQVHMKRTATLDDGISAIYKHFDAGRSLSWFEAGNPGGVEQVLGLGKGRTKPKGSSIGTDITKGKAVTADANVTIADERSPEVTRAIAGPEPERPLASLRAIRLNEPEALIEAARQYTNRSSEVQKHIEALQGLGVEVDVAKVMEGVKLVEDRDLELVSTLLPYIDRLERTNSRLTAEAGSFKGDVIEMRREIGVLTKERNDYKAANQRLSERNIKLAEAAKPVTANA